MTQEYTSDLALFINGSWRSGQGRETLRVLNPALGSGIADLPVATAADLEEALAAAEQGFKEWRMVDVDTRGAILRKAAALIRERAAVMALLLTTEQGPAALLLFEDAQGQRTSLYLRSPGSLYAQMPSGAREDGELQARYWSQAGYNYALVSAAADGRAEQLRNVLDIAL